MSLPLATAVGIDLDLRSLRWPHAGELGLLEVGRDPDLTKRNDGHQVLAAGYVRTYLHGALADNAIHWSHDGGVGEIQLRLIKRSFGALRQGIGGLCLGLGCGHRIRRGPRVAYFSGSLFYAGLGLFHLRLRSQ